MENIRSALGRRIRELRKTKRWSQEELGERAGLHPTYVGGIERGERNVSLENIERLANAFDLTLSQLFDFQRAKQSRSDILRATVASLLVRRERRELEFLLAVIEALDRWKKGGAETQSSQ